MRALLPLILTCGAIGAFLLGVRGAPAQVPAPQGPAHGQGSSPGDGKTDVKGVVELFTSQGCSSCPPADALFGKLSKRSDLLVLTMPVDYWDYLGWKDTLASPDNTARQKAYAHARGDGQVYTPQAVINGQVHANGSSEGQIESALRKTEVKSQARVSLKGWSEPDAFVIETGASPTPAKATVLVALVMRQAEVAIGRGENQGRKVMYANVVRRLIPVGEWNGKPSTLRLSRAQLAPDGFDFCAVLLQQGRSGPILAGAEIKMN